MSKIKRLVFFGIPLAFLLLFKTTTSTRAVIVDEPPPPPPPRDTGGGGGGGGSTCFPAGTKVTMADGEFKNIEDISIGDSVLSQGDNGIQSASTVAGVETPIRDNMCSINFSNGESLDLTSEHPMFTSEGWKSIDPSKMYLENPNFAVKALRSGDKIMGSDGDYVNISSISCISESIQTYNLLLEGQTHTYFVDGLLTHNKVEEGCGACNPPPPPQDPLPPDGECNTNVCNYDGNVVPVGTIIRYDVNGYDYCYVAGGGDCGASGTPNEIEVTAGCDVTAPTNIIAGPYNSNVALVTTTWTPGQNLGYQEFYMGSDKTEVDNDCSPVTSCVAHGSMPAEQTELTLQNSITPSTLYAGKIKSIKYPGCDASSTFTYLPSCSLIPDNSTIILDGAPIVLTSQIDDTQTASALIDRVTYSVSSDPDGSAQMQSETGNHDTTWPYQVSVSGTSLGRVRVDSTVTGASNNTLCTSSAYVTIAPPPPWWQVQDSDVQANGDLSSDVPSSNYFGLLANYLNGFPGIPAYSGGTNLTNENATESFGWLAQSPWLNSRTFGYDYFSNLIPSDIQIKSVSSEAELTGATADADGYKWYKYDGSGGPFSIDSSLDVGGSLAKVLSLFRVSPAL